LWPTDFRCFLLWRLPPQQTKQPRKLIMNKHANVVHVKARYPVPILYDKPRSDPTSLMTLPIKRPATVTMTDATAAQIHPRNEMTKIQVPSPTSRLLPTTIATALSTMIMNDRPMIAAYNPVRAFSRSLARSIYISLGPSGT